MLSGLSTPVTNNEGSYYIAPFITRIDRSDTLLYFGDSPAFVQTKQYQAT